MPRCSIGSSTTFQARREAASTKYRRRIDSACHETAAQLVNYAVRSLAVAGGRVRRRRLPRRWTSLGLRRSPIKHRSGVKEARVNAVKRAEGQIVDRFAPKRLTRFGAGEIDEGLDPLPYLFFLHKVI